jgi:hypothetical protein
MSGLRFSDVQDRPREFVELTSLTLEEFASLVAEFEQDFQGYMSQWRMDGKPRTGRRYSTYQNCPLPSAADRLLFVLNYLKNNPLQVTHGRLFGMVQCKANVWLHVLLPVLRTTLTRLGTTPSRTVQALAQRLDVELTTVAASLADREVSLTGEAWQAEPPLFVTTAQNGASNGHKLRQNRRLAIAARKRPTP